MLDELFKKTLIAVEREGRFLNQLGKVINTKIDTSNLYADVIDNLQEYHVKITSYKYSHIDATCTCNYSWLGYCKHIAAVVHHMKLRSDLDIKPPAQYGLNRYRNIISHYTQPSLRNRKINREAETPLEITDLDKDEFLRKEILSKWSLSERLQVERGFMFNDTLYFNIKSNQNYYPKQQTIRIYRDQYKVFINCNCKRVGTAVCSHESFLLSKMRDRKFNYLNLVYQKSDSAVAHLAKLEGIPKSLANTSNLDLIIGSDFKIKLGYKNKLEHLISFDQLIGTKWDEKFQSDLTHSKFVNHYDNYEYMEQAMAIVLEIDARRQLIRPTCIVGKATKCRTRLVSNIKEITASNFKRSFLSSREKEIFNICQELTDLHSYSSRHTPTTNLDVLQMLWDKLEPQDILYYKNEISLDWRKVKRGDLNLIGFEKEKAQISFHAKELTHVLDLQMHITIGKEKVDITKIQPFPPHMIMYEEKCVLVQNIAQGQLLTNLNELTRIQVAQKHKDMFVDKLLTKLAKQHPLTCNFLENIRGRILKRYLYIDETSSHLLFTPIVEYLGDVRSNPLERGSKIIQNGTAIQRDVKGEKKFIELLVTQNADWESQQSNQTGFAIDLNSVFDNNWFYDFFETISNAGIEVNGFNKLFRFRYSPHKAKVKYRIKSAEDWFETHVDVAFGDQHISINDLKKQLKSGNKYIKLNNGTLGAIPEDWLKQIKQLVQISSGTTEEDSLKISKLKFNVLDELAELIESAEVKAELREKQNRLKSFTEIKDTEVPTTINAKLRPYQLAGLNWLNFLDEFKWGGILADDMGLGKTLQMLTFLAQQNTKGAGTSLVIVPTTLIFNWENEIEKFCPSLKILVHYSNSRQKDHTHFSEYDIILTTYGLMVNDNTILKEFLFNYIILDESQAIKNTQSQRYKAAIQLKAKNKLALTGTPIENNTFDLYAQMNFVNVGFLGTMYSFRHEYSNAIDKERNSDVAAHLQKMISPFVLRRTKEEVATELPPKTEDIIYCTMDDEQRKVYDAYRNKYRNFLQGKLEESGIEKNKLFVLEGLTKLRQICDSPALINENSAESVKISELIRHIENKTANHKIVVFSQFVSMLSLIRKELDNRKINYEYLDGATSQISRRDNVKHFQEDEKCRVFLISLKAGGTGLNLTTADYVYLVDPWWNPAVENQAIDRCYRIGQTKKVFAYRMICKDTIEEKIVNYQQRKREVASELIHSEQSFMKELTKDELMHLLS